jgi:cell division control protein 45
MDSDLKRSLRQKVESIAPEYGLFDLAYSSFVRANGYQSLLSASDCIEGVRALLEVAHGVGGLDLGDNVGEKEKMLEKVGLRRWDAEDDKENRVPDGEPPPVVAAASEEGGETDAEIGRKKKKDEWWVRNFWHAWDALGSE